MTYALGIDVGSTRTAAAVWADGAATVVPLTPTSLTLPSVVLLQPDGSLLVGAEADLLGAAQPERVARSFRGQVGDPVPRLLGEEEVGVTELVSALLELVVAIVTQRIGSPPAHVVLTCPASWGPHLRAALTSAAEHAGLSDVGLVTEPVAAAVHHAVAEPFPVGANLLVYDLGGADLDVSVVTRTATGYEEVGPAGHDPDIGGEVIDEKVMDHLRVTLRQAMLQLDPDDEDVRSALWGVRRAAVAAKEQLSSDTETEILVQLPGLVRRVRLTRGELESTVRPLVLGSVDVVLDTLDRAGLTADDLEAVLLTGGSSAVPLVSRLVGGAVKARVVVDAQPKLAVCLGAALTGAARVGTAAQQRVPEQERPPAAVVADTDDLAALVAEAPVLRSAPEDAGIHAPLDIPLPTRPDPDRPRRQVVSEVFEYGSGAHPSGLRAAVVTVVLLLVAAAAVALAVFQPGGGVADVAVAEPTAASAVPEQELPAPPVPLVPAGEPTPVGEPGQEVTALLALPDGTMLAVGHDTEAEVPRAWRLAGAAVEPVSAPAAGAGRSGALSGLAIAGDTVVAVGWTAPDDADPFDTRVRTAAAWVTPTALGLPWRLVEVPGATELTAVTAVPGGALTAAGISYTDDEADGDAVVLSSVDGTSWREAPTLAFAGPGPARVVALAASADTVTGAVERLEGASVRAGLVRSTGGMPWEEGGPLDGEGPTVAQVEDATVLPDGRTILVGGAVGVGVGDARSFVWLVDADAHRLLEVSGMGLLSAVAVAGDVPAVVGERPGNSGPAAAQIVPPVGS